MLHSDVESESPEMTVQYGISGISYPMHIISISVRGS